MICRCHVQAVGCGHNGEWCQHFTINHCWEPNTELPGGFLAKLNQILISSTDQFGQQMPVWPVWPVSQNQLKFVQEMVVQVVSCVLLEMSLAFLGILCNLLVVTTIRHQVIFLFWSRILLTMIMICNQEFAVYGEKTQEELQNSTTNLLLINLCFSNLLVSFLVNKLFFRDQFRSIWKYLKFIETEKGVSSEILSVGKAKAEKGSINQSIVIAKQTHFLENFCWVVFTQPYLWLGYVFPAGYGTPISSHFSADSNKIFLFDEYIED